MDSSLVLVMLCLAAGAGFIAGKRNLDTEVIGKLREFNRSLAADNARVVLEILNERQAVGSGQS